MLRRLTSLIEAMFSGLPGFGGQSAANAGAAGAAEAPPAARSTGLFGSIGGLGRQSEASRVSAETPADDTAGEKSNNWSLHLGPLSLGSQGVDLKPQFKVGGHVRNFKAEAGLSDVRDGLKLAVKAQASLEVTAKGHSVAELHENIQCDTPGFREALVAAQKLLAQGAKDSAALAASGLAQLAKALKTDTKTLQRLFSGTSEEEVPASAMTAASPDAPPSAPSSSSPGRPPMTLKVKASTGVGASAEVRLGWCDTKGYHMVGVGGKATAGLTAGCTVFAGRHTKGSSVKIILGFSNFQFEYTFPAGGELGKPPSVDPEEGGGAGLPASTAASANSPPDLLSEDAPAVGAAPREAPPLIDY